MKKYTKYKQSNKEFDEMTENIKKLCAIPSISKYDENNEFPFGKEVDDALNFALVLAKRFGFKIYKDKNKKYGFAQIGDGKKIIGILAHLDVVPAGDEDQWISSAFDPIKKENELFGRGSLDDKGPAIINLYAMKYIYDKKLLDKEWAIRIIFGLSEETTMLSMKEYLHDFGEPYISYTPDGEWPLIYAEKMVYHVNLCFPKIENLYLKAGEVVNQIPDTLYVKYPKVEEITKFLNKNDYQLDKKLSILTIKGIGGHGSTPEKGDNAIIKFLKAFKETFSEYENNSLIKFISDNFSDNDFELKNIFPNYTDFSGPLSANLGIINTNDDGYILSFDLRVPVTHNKNQVYSDLSKYVAKLNKKIIIDPIGFKPAKYIEKDNKLVTILMQTFNEGMKTNEEPLAIGGGTYARIVKNCVAFGSTKYMHLMHGPNERFTYKEMKESLEIYINALIRLQEYDN
ncbi:Sapep family Mn(2+)-dependent dipeptidase [Metamycoplasma buccale]|uniref:Sapep family Mn(2+)-dependent dipeptidase n=1 Tax=Metamycoplasma buccale TaxID=55602 RepID=UPI00398EB971